MDDASKSAAAPRAARWRLLAVIVCGGAAIFAALRYNTFIGDGGTRILASNATLLATAALVFVWFLRTVPLGRRIKTALVVVVLGAVAVPAALFRIEYVGDLNPVASFKLRTWARKAARGMGIELDEVHHAERLAEAPLALESAPGDSPRFFGPEGDGEFQLVPPGKLARDWSAKPPRELWRSRVGEGWSSFAVVGGYAFTQETTPDHDSEQVVCYDLADGSVKWAHGDEGFYESSLGGDGPRATPTFFQGKLLTVGPTGLLNCLDAATGRPLWSHQVVKESGATLPDWGISSSPLAFTSQTHGDLVVQSAGGPNGKSLHAYRLEDGGEVWSVGDDPPGYSSPQLRTLGGITQIVLANWQAVTGHDPETGRELWRYDDEHDWHGSQPKVPQPIVFDDGRVFVSAGYGTGCVMLEVTRDGDRWNVATKWTSSKLKPKFMNPVARDGHVYGLDDGQFLVCLDLAGGDLKWRSKRGADYGHGQVLLVDDLLLVQSEAGDVALVAADPKEYRELTRFTALPEGVSWNVPVIAGRKLLLRNNLEAACYELPVE